jgi:acyl carrier protein|tara:strand:+ start:3475 stop:3705 length:231 start_codon:yes stop_codon:yes gene_type:complete
MENKIKKILKKIVSKSTNISSKTNLISSGILDSFNILVLIGKLEKEFKIKIPLNKFDINSLNSISKISQFIKKKNR